MDRVFLKNFRCFREEQTARLAPLTLLVGENSTGKTSFLALIRALWEAGYNGQHPDFKEAPYDLGSFDEIANFRGARAGRTKRFEAGFAVADKRRKRARRSSQRFDVTFEKKANAPVPVINRLMDLIDEERNVWMESDRRSGKPLQYHIGTPKGQWYWDVPDNHWYYDVSQFDPWIMFTAFRDTHGAWVSMSNAATTPDDEDWKMILGLRQNFLSRRRLPNPTVYASAPVRSKPRRTYDRSQLTWDSEGDYIPMYLADVHSQDPDGWEDIQKKLEDFGQSAGLFDKISVRTLGNKAGDPFQLQIRKYGRKYKGPARNLIDVGYGVSQALPVVTELLRGEAPLFLLQQPEVHLHPSAQAALGSLFCRIAAPERQLVVETHSDHLLDRVRMDVRDQKGVLKPEDVSILFFERGDLDVRIHSLELDGDGNVLGAPPGYRDFFKAETRRSLGL